MGSGIFFFNDTATTEIYTLSLHDALPIFRPARTCGRPEGQGYEGAGQHQRSCGIEGEVVGACQVRDRKSTRLNSSHANISYAVFCLKKKRLVPIRSCAVRTALRREPPLLH